MQNLATVRLTDTDLADFDNALGVVRRVFNQFVVLQPEQRRALTKMGGKSEMFCRQTLDMLASNPQIVPPSINVGDARDDLAALDALRPRLQQLRQLVERGEDTSLALGSDAMSCALAGYALLKVAGKGEALKGARRQLSARFSKSPRAETPTEAL
jgi:hypothetical protein